MARPHRTINNSYTISEMKGMFDISLKALRLYEEKELLQPARCQNQRSYSEIDCVRLQIILRAKRFGFSLLEIWMLLNKRSQSDLLAILDAPALGLSRQHLKDRLDKLEAKRAEVEEALASLYAAEMFRPN